jgi:predicted DNA-binding WGR domain protein
MSTQRTIRTNVNCTSTGQVYRTADKGSAFKAYVTFRGWTDSGNRSRKFWEICGRGNGTVTVRWGRIGTSGRSQVIPFYEAMDRLYKKLDKGYRF